MPDVPTTSCAAKKIQSLSKLYKVKRLASGTFGAAARHRLVVLRQEGLDPNGNVIRLQMGGGDARFCRPVLRYR